MKNIFFLFLLFLLSACEWSDSSESANVGLVKTLSEDQVIERTLNDFPVEEKTQEDIDRKLILNHIIDNKLDMESTPDGIYYQIIKKGPGIQPSKKDVIEAHYHGTFLDGRVFDSTIGKKPFTHPLWRMNKGWQKIIPTMNVGSKGIFIIPSGLCYGETGWGELIPPNAVLKFEIELLGIK